MVDIDDMKPGPELDALVLVEVLGWRLTPHDFGHDLPGGPFKALGYDDKGRHVRGLLNPSTDIAAAWKVWLHLNKAGFQVELAFSEFALPSVTGPTRFAYGVEFFGYVDEQDISVSAYADTAPHAICLAALKAVGYKDTTPE